VAADVASGYPDGMGPWDDGRRAWERLDGWDQDGPVPGHPDDGNGALAALSDIGTVRRLLDQAELAAVRTARRHGKSWAEIATRLGVTRQSAWERWRDLDDEPDDAVGRTAQELAVRQRRRQSSVLVPSVIGLSWTDAQQRLTAVGLVAMSADLDGVVTDQSPEAGARVPAGSPVRLWVDRGGGSGVREPRRPRPAPRSGRALPPERSDEAVG
jgi:PASTA domain